MNTSQLICFLTVADTLNFAKAAKQLNLTQPAVTKQIQSLEEELQIKLFHRTTRTVELTHDGILFITDSKNILRIMERAKRRSEGSLEDVRKPLIIGCHEHSEIYLFSDIWKQLKIQDPNIYPVFRVSPFSLLFQYLTEQTIDVILSFQEIKRQKNFIYEELLQIPLVGVVTKEHPLSGKQTLSKEDWKSEKLILTEPRKCPERITKFQFQMLEEKSMLDVYLSDSILSSLALARANYGIAIVPDVFLIKDEALSYLPIEGTTSLSYGIYYNKNTASSKIESFIHTCKEILPS